MTSAPFRSLEQTFGGATLRVEYRSITDVEADVLVSSDDTNLSMSGGVSLVLLSGGGESVFVAAQEQAPLPLGGVAVTTAGRLHAAKIFHAAVLDSTRESAVSVELVRGVTRTCLERCDKLGLNSICFPALATGSAELSPERSAFAMLMEIAAYLGEPRRLRAVTIALFPHRSSQGDDFISRFFAQVTDFLELTRRLEGTTAAIEAMERAYRERGAVGEAISAVSFRTKLRAHRAGWEEALSATEPGDTQRERGWLVPFEQMESDLLEMPVPAAHAARNVPVAPAGPAKASPPPAFDAALLGLELIEGDELNMHRSGPFKSSFAPGSPPSNHESESPAPGPRPAPVQTNAPAAPAPPPPAQRSPREDWAAVERRCKEERRGMLRALVAIRERDLVQLELDAALRSAAIDDQVMIAAQARLEWLKTQLGQLEQDLVAGGDRISLVDTHGSPPRASAKTLNILHLSDLHFGTEANAQSWYQQLTADLSAELGCERLDCAVLSGDIANRSVKP